MDAASITALVLIGLAVALLLMETLFGSDGSLLALAVICVVAGCVFGVRGAWPAGPFEWWVYLLAAGLGLPGLIAVGMFLFPRTELGRELLDGPHPEETDPFAPGADGRIEWIGCRGKAVSLMNPGGMILVNGDRLHAESEGLVIEPGETVVVVGFRANRAVVRPASIGDVGIHNTGIPNTGIPNTGIPNTGIPNTEIPNTEAGPAPDHPPA